MTLKRVAEIAGVSIATASRVLAGKGDAHRISDATVAAVRAAAESIGFRHSQVARSLKSGQSALLGVVVPDVSNPFFAAIAREVTLAAEAKGYSVLLADSREDDVTEQRLVQQLRDRRIEGLVVCPAGLTQDHLSAAQDDGLPLVVVDRGFAGGALLTVTSDHAQGARALAAVLLNAGHRHIGVLQGRPGTLANDERLSAFKESLADAGVRLPTSHVRGEAFSESSGKTAAMALLSSQPAITALFALSNQIALGALRAAAERGRVVPRDLSLVTFDDLPHAEFLNPPLTTACQDVPALGRRAADLLLGRIAGAARPRTRMQRIPVTVIERASVTPPSSRPTSRKVRP
ncbi:MAG TPA: LacI family DNA-binding transcriptional regulator [Planctomycetota bacterium]|nr:LacI family DNA-binding transcriptional regulator [Planctomycetota bacterium]